MQNRRTINFDALQDVNSDSIDYLLDVITITAIQNLYLPLAMFS